MIGAIAAVGFWFIAWKAWKEVGPDVRRAIGEWKERR